MKKLLQDSVKDAMKSRDKQRVSAIRSVIAAMQYEEMQKNVDELPETDCIKVIKSEIKKRNEEMEFAEKADRAETIASLKAEIEILNSFLPAQLSEAELEKIITELKESEPEINLGMVMKKLNETHSGQFDGKLASTVARKIVS